MVMTDEIARKRLMAHAQPAKIIPQKRATSQTLTYWKAVQVKLTKPFPAHVRYNKDYTISKRQPKPYKPGDLVWARLKTDGNVSLYPFELAGQGYEIVMDAWEHLHYEFV